ncbi:efflux RND transporter periplasmic adaptor subunit [Marinagarivorans cellulosilyticus]|uniref:Membrane fusion protein, cobalt-zinc-cadmium efflux system n=1 Tax=Marinagarivorans cellulosilyticus TaxID=2721545 RepID=A0AAN1WJF7_9GAMM|nr:efflux RND transporter periplasmic adaptor subunit [Marinagarivorans cellulosilyticus]BCD98725.1 membrane fusion protein, cobalt-zinc-cadmium efflux system [Marinagarivorans cellulosilyticus]
MTQFLLSIKQITAVVCVGVFSLCTHATPLASGIEPHNDTHNKHEHHDEHGHEDDHGHVSKSHIAQAIADEVGITTSIAGPRTLQQSIKVYGELNSGPEQTSHVRARFSGVIDSVYATIGDNVKAGDLLAVVESNQSLKKFQIKAPISGTIIQRHANPGEVTQAQILFSITQLNSLWAELHIFPTQRSQIKKHAAVTITINNEQYQTNIAHILPSINKPFSIARAKVGNPSQHLSPSTMLEAAIYTNTIDVNVAVNKNALQSLEGQAGVFIKAGDAFTFRAVKTGQEDKSFIEISSGLAAGEEYVVGNSFLIKADIKKSEAEHNH